MPLGTPWGAWGPDDGGGLGVMCEPGPETHGMDAGPAPAQQVGPAQRRPPRLGGLDDSDGSICTEEPEELDDPEAFC